MLYLISTPIGNLGDISQRARAILESVPVLACEDTRTTGQLLSLLGITAHKLIAYHEHNEQTASKQLMQYLEQGIDVGVVSDAGTPLLSDPGYRLVQLCLDHHIPVTAVPGANALLPALQLSGMPTHAFLFGGFLPAKSGARQSHLNQFKTTPATLIFYETPNRLADALVDIQTVLGDVFVATVREITKKFEEVKRGPVSELIQFYRDNPTKGEMVVLIDNTLPQKQDTDIDSLIRDLLPDHSVKEIARLLHEQTGLSKKEIYERALALK